MTTAVMTKDTKTELAKDESVKRSTEKGIIPEYQIRQNASDFTITLRMPGVSEDDLELQVKDRLLTVRGKSAHPIYDGFQLVYGELPDADYEASFRLPEGIDDEGISARLTNGVLTVTLPKAEEEKPKIIKVNVS